MDVSPEIIGGLDISIVSGAEVHNEVPDAGSTLVLMGIGVGLLAAARRKLLS